MSNYVGQNIPRNDGWDKVTGNGMFTHDIKVPGMLYAAVLRSPYAHARIVSIDTSEAEALPGVYAVASYKNTTRKFFSTSAAMVTTVPGAEPVLDQQIFPEIVRYIGDEVAAVAAKTEKIALEALELIKVEYEILDAVYDPIEAMNAGSPQVQPDFSPGQNICGEPVEFGLGNVEEGWKEGEVFSDVTVVLPRVKQAQLETHSAVATYKNGQLEVVCTSQTPHPTKMMLARIFDMPESKIIVENPPYVGGGFGVRIGMSGKAELIATQLSMLAHKPVKYTYSREEDFLASDTRHGGYITCRLAAKKDGTFVAIDTKSVLNTGAYATFGVELAGVTGACGTAGTYMIPNLHYIGYPIYTNQQTAGAFRGFGTPQGTMAVETAVDDIAKQLNMDPIEIRKKNTVKTGDNWWFPFPVGSTGLNDCIDKAADSIGWKEKRGSEQSGNIRRGVGIAAGTHVSNAAPFCVDYNGIYLRIEGDGTLHVASGVPEIGPGSTTGTLQIAADIIGVPMDTINIEFGSTVSTPFDIGSHATRTLYTVGHLLTKVGKELKEDILNWTADFINKDRMLIESNKKIDSQRMSDMGWPTVEAGSLDMNEGIIIGENIEIPLSVLAYEAHIRGKQFVASKSDVPPNSPPWHAHAAEVEVDMETGMVKVLKIAAAHDIGKAINPILVEGQIEGGVVMGVGYAIHEEMTYVEEKGFYNKGFHKYMLPTFDVMPEIDSILVESNDPSGPFGAKGIGECGLIPTAPAIAAAVEDAIGIRFYEIPMTPERVLKKIKEVYGSDK